MEAPAGEPLGPKKGPKNPFFSDFRWVLNNSPSRDRIRDILGQNGTGFWTDLGEFLSLPSVDKIIYSGKTKLTEALAASYTFCH